MNKESFKKRLKLSGNLRNFKYIKRLKEKNRLLIQDRVISDAVFLEFRTLVKHLDAIYAGAWDFEVNITMARNKISIDIKSILIKFDELHLNNSGGDEHTIKDLIVKLRLHANPSKLILYNILGTRLTLTQRELESNYFHSHLDLYAQVMREPIHESFGSFCTGSGEINAYRMEVNEDGFDDVTTIKFLLQLSTLVSWESLEGTPYKKMRNIFNRSENRMLNMSRHTILEQRKKQYYESFLREHKTNNTYPKISFNFTAEGYSVKESVELDSILKTTVATPSLVKTFFCLKDEAGNSYEITESNSLNFAPSSHTLIFRGEELTRTIELEERQETLSVPVIKPELKQYIIQRINNEINSKAIRQSTINRYQS